MGEPTNIDRPDEQVDGGPTDREPSGLDGSISCILDCDDHFGSFPLLWPVRMVNSTLLANVLPCLTRRRRFATNVRSPRPRPTVSTTRISRAAEAHHPDRRRPPLLRNTTVCRIDCCNQHPSLGQSPAASQPQSTTTAKPAKQGPPCSARPPSLRAQYRPGADWVGGRDRLHPVSSAPS